MRFVVANVVQARCLEMLVAPAVENGRQRLRQKQPPWLAELGREVADQKTRVYLLTFARVLSDRLGRGGLKDVAELSRQELLDCVRDSWDNPVDSRHYGRPRADGATPLVQKTVVYQDKSTPSAPFKHTFLQSVFFLTICFLLQRKADTHVYLCFLFEQKC